MYLKSLVLKGFKSFADRSALAMEPGITAIVGPNGSGKSNISDAVLWVLGERNAKHLRGQAMEDVIFAGSSARKPVSVAEVELVLDNSDGTLPVDYDEVSIARRMYRNGESEYLINGTLARRMDVLDILHDSGLGTGTHSIISQGSLDSILQSKPEDRRALIEEAAGVLKHKQRKTKSERKLAAMDQHLDRVGDIVGEVERQLGPLERKAKRAIAYQEVSAELADLNLRLAVDDLRALQAKWDASAVAEKDLESDLASKRELIKRAEELTERITEKLRLESADTSDIARRHREASAAVERLDSAMMLMRERRRAATDRAGELEVAMESAKAKRIATEADAAQMTMQLEEASLLHAEAGTLAADLDQKHESLSAERVELERRATELGRNARGLESRLDAARRRLAQMQEVLANGLAHVKLIEGRGKELALQLERAQSDAQRMTDEALRCDEKLREVSDLEAAARNKVALAFQAREDARAADDAARNEVNRIATEIMGLEEVERASAAAAGPALAWVLEQGEALDAQLAPISHAISAPQGMESLVELLLGADVAALLVGSAQDALRVADALAVEGAAGEVALVMREDGAAPVEARSLKRASDACGVSLVSLLAYPEDARRAVCALLGDVVVCDSLAQALEEHRGDSLGLRFVTPQGAIVWANGKITLGAAVSENEEGVLARVRRLEALREERGEAIAQSAVCKEALKAAEEALRASQAESLALSQTLAESRGQADAARAQADAAQEKLGSVRRELEDVERQRKAAEEDISQARPDVEGLSAECKQLEHDLEETRQQLAQAQESVAPLREQAADLSERLSAARLKEAKLAEKKTYVERVLQARHEELAAIDASATQSREMLRAKSVSAARIKPLLDLFEELSAAARAWTVRLEEQAAQAEDASSSLHAQANEARASLREAHESFDAANDRLAAARVEKGRLEIQVETAVNVIVHDCKTPLETALKLAPLEDRSTAESEAFKLRRRISNMGTINPDAAEEFERLKKRYDYLKAQLDDLASARKCLMKINRVIDARMKEDFIRTYEEVDRNFQEIFGVLFPGGSAHLSLVDPDDLENTGVEVTAQPRGKRITKMMLMSGGEKSLTAIALLFAVYRIRTTPFYILDEVEAALDDSNLRRLVSYIDSLRDTTQLIMITHQRRTMEMADVLFGVSMQADGVTKVISQRLDRALQYAE